MEQGIGHNGNGEGSSQSPKIGHLSSPKSPQNNNKLNVNNSKNDNNNITMFPSSPFLQGPPGPQSLSGFQLGQTHRSSQLRVPTASPPRPSPGSPASRPSPGSPASRPSHASNPPSSSSPQSQGAGASRRSP